MSCRPLTLAHESCVFSLRKQRDQFFPTLLSNTEKYLYQLLDTWSPDYLVGGCLVFQKVENNSQGGVSIAATIWCPLVGKCLEVK